MQMTYSLQIVKQFPHKAKKTPTDQVSFRIHSMYNGSLNGSYASSRPKIS